MVDARNGETFFTFDGLNRVIERTNPLNLTIERTYDNRGNLLSLTREDGSVETASYDALSRRVQIVTPDNTLAYSYDPFSNLTEASDDDSRLTFHYDDMNRVTSAATDGTAGPQPAVTLTYSYDLLGRRISMSDSLGGISGYAWNDQDWLVGLEAPWGTEFTFGYDNAGRRTSLTSTDGRATTLGYTEGLLTELLHIQGAATLADRAFQYTVDGQLQQMTDALDPTKSLIYSYDALNRLIGVSRGTPALPIENYSYDGEGNRLSSQLSATYVSNANNQLTEDDTYTYAYDLRGNRVSRTAKVGGAVETYAYDSQNRLVEYSDGTDTVEYAYDALDRRIAKITGSDTEAYIIDAWTIAASTSSDRVADFLNGNLVRRWTFGPWVDEPLGYETYSGSTLPGTGTSYELFADRLGSIETVVVSATGAVVAEYSYDAFGNRQATGTEDQPYGFTGREHDDETGLIYLRARQYDPRTGVFAQRDPIGFAGGDLNLYAYVWNDPVNWTDPSGLNANTMTGRYLGLSTMAVAGAQNAMNVMMRWCMARPQCNTATLRGLAQAIDGIGGALGIGEQAGTGTGTAGADDYAAGAEGIGKIFAGVLGAVDKILQHLNEIGQRLAMQSEGSGGSGGPSGGDGSDGGDGGDSGDGGDGDDGGPEIQFGNRQDPNQQHHIDRHISDTGVSRDAIEAEGRSAVRDAVNNGRLGQAGSSIRETVTVGGVRFEFRAFNLGSRINVGTVFSIN